MITEPFTLTGSVNSVNDALTMVRTSINGTNSVWVATDPAAGYRATMEFRHTKPAKTKLARLPVYRSNVVVKLEKYDSSADAWDPIVCSFTLTSLGLNGPYANTDIEDAWNYIKNSILTSAHMVKMIRQEV